MKVIAVAEVPGEVLRDLSARVQDHRALRRALDAGLRMIESVPMDEFTRDVLCGPEDGFWLAYDTT